MRINKGLKPWAVCSTEKNREVLAQFCYLDVEKALLISTDGRALARTPVDVDDGDVSGLVPVAALKEAGRKGVMRAGIVYLDCTAADAVKLFDGRTFPRATSGGQQFPMWEQVMPKNDGKATIRLAINPCLLAALFSAMGDPEGSGAILTFQVDAEGDAKQLPITVEAAGMTSVIMPMKLKSRAPNRLDDIEQAHAVALGELDINAADAANASKGAR